MLALLRAADLPETGVAETFRNFVVVRDDETVVAAAGLEVEGDVGLLRSVVVDPAFRGQGLAGLLVAGAVELASHLDLRALYLLTTTARGLLPEARLRRLPARGGARRPSARAGSSRPAAPRAPRS